MCCFISVVFAYKRSFMCALNSPMLLGGLKMYPSKTGVCKYFYFRAIWDYVQVAAGRGAQDENSVLQKLLNNV
jgi:hypothetical protein